MGKDVGGVVTQGVGVGKKIFGRLWRPKIYHPPGPWVKRRKGVVRQNFRLKGGGPTPHHPPLAHVW